MPAMPGLTEAEDRVRLKRLRSATGIAHPTGYRFFRGFIALISKPFISVTVLGEENIPAPQGTVRGIKYYPRWYFRKGLAIIDDYPFILALNHGSIWDIPGVGIFRRPFVWICKADFCTYLWVAVVCQWMGAISVFRNRQDTNPDKYTPAQIIARRKVTHTGSEALEKTVKALRRGIPAIWFPEGAREALEQVETAQSGAAVAALRAGVPLVPAALVGCGKKPLKTTRWLRRRRIVLIIGQPLEPYAYAMLAGGEQADAMANDWREAVNELMERGKQYL